MTGITKEQRERLERLQGQEDSAWVSWDPACSCKDCTRDRLALRAALTALDQYEARVRELENEIARLRTEWTPPQDDLEESNRVEAELQRQHSQRREEE